MGLTAESFAGVQKKLLPSGRVWKLIESVLEKAFLAAGDELVRVDGRGQDLIDESDPRTTDELLPDFERVLGLTATGTLAERQNRVVALLVRRQRVRPVDYQQALARLLGQAAGSVVVIERTRAQAVAIGDAREIYRFFIYRNPSDPGTYDLAGAQATVNKMKHSHTLGQVIESIGMIVDQAFSIVDRDIIGA